MRAVLQLLRLCFWALPAQRVLVVGGALLTLAMCLWVAPYHLSSQAPLAARIDVLAWATFGVMVTFLPALVLGGPLWRALAAQRAVTLAPGGRTRLLAGAIAVAVLGALVHALVYFLLFQWVEPRLRMDLQAYGRIFSGTLLFATWWGIASFFASRSALASFAVVAVLIGISYGVAMLDLPAPASLPPRAGILVLVTQWGLFGWWFLSVRRIGRSAWLSRGGAEALLVTGADTSGIAAGATREAALERLLLDGNSALRFSGKWLVALALMLGIELTLAGVVFDSTPRLLAGALYGSLLILLVGITTVGESAASRLRSLWLPSALSRAQLFALAERSLWKVAALFMVMGAVFLAAVWFALSWRPAAGLDYGLWTLLGGMLLPAYGALWGRTAWKWPVIAATLAVAIHTYWAVFVSGAPARSGWWLAVLLVATVALRWLARRRWLAADMPRAATSQAS